MIVPPAAPIRGRVLADTEIEDGALEAFGLTHQPWHADIAPGPAVDPGGAHAPAPRGRRGIRGRGRGRGDIDVPLAPEAPDGDAVPEPARGRGGGRGRPRGRRAG